MHYFLKPNFRRLLLIGVVQAATLFSVSGQTSPVSLGTIDPTTPGVRVPTGFLSFSADYGTVTNFLLDQPLYSQYYSNLTALTGPPNLRLGGSATDLTYVSINGNTSVTNSYNYFTPPTSYSGLLTNTLNSIVSFAKSTGIKLILDVNVAGYNTQTSAPNPPTLNSSNQLLWITSITNSCQALGFSVTNIGFELGNEPDHWAHTFLYRDTTWSSAQYQTNLNSIAGVVRRTVGMSGFNLVGPAYGGQRLSSNAFINQSPTMASLIAGATLNTATVHWYAHNAPSITSYGLPLSSQIQLLLLGIYTNATSTNSEISPYASGAELGPLYSNVIASSGSTPL